MSTQLNVWTEQISSIMEITFYEILWNRIFGVVLQPLNPWFCLFFQQFFSFFLLSLSTFLWFDGWRAWWQKTINLTKCISLISIYFYTVYTQHSPFFPTIHHIYIFFCFTFILCESVWIAEPGKKTLKLHFHQDFKIFCFARFLLKRCCVLCVWSGCVFYILKFFFSLFCDHFVLYLFLVFLLKTFQMKWKQQNTKTTTKQQQMAHWVIFLDFL